MKKFKSNIETMLHSKDRLLAVNRQYILQPQEGIAEFLNTLSLLYAYKSRLQYGISSSREKSRMARRKQLKESN
eukprot:2148061-Ditylum_brightwellii.AAC.1